MKFYVLGNPKQRQVFTKRNLMDTALMDTALMDTAYFYLMGTACFSEKT